jgi:hypothetical protein
MTKIKLLNYGNCQLCVVSNYLEKYFSNEFDIISCEDFNLETFWNKSKTFCVWKRGYNKENQNKYYKRVHEKIAEADVFLFQDHSGNNNIDYLKTEYLQNEIAKKHNTRCIAVHNYCEQDIYPDRKWMIKYAVSQDITDANEIDAFLRKSSDSYFAEYMKKSFKKSRIQNKEWENKANNIYDDYISMNDFIMDNYDKKLLSHSLYHPTEHYFAEFTTRILNKFNLKFDESTICEFDQPNFIGHPYEYEFFNKAFPNITDSCIRNDDLTAKKINSILRNLL